MADTQTGLGQLSLGAPQQAVGNLAGTSLDPNPKDGQGALGTKAIAK
jgi:hypothetical protein